MQAWNWMGSLESTGALKELHPIIHHVGTSPTYFADAVHYMGIEMNVVDSFGTGPAVYCNKLQQLEFLGTKRTNYVILCDVDLAFSTSPIDLIRNNNVRAKLVDKPNPNPNHLAALLEKAGFDHEPLNAIPTHAPNAKTHYLNCNGGLYVVPHMDLRLLAGIWRKWAAFCLNQTEILGKAVLHADQLGFMLSMISLKLPFSPLSEEDNFPIHFSSEHYENTICHNPSTLHYHWKLDQNGKIIATGVDYIDAKIKSINSILATYDGNQHFRVIRDAFQDMCKKVASK